MDGVRTVRFLPSEMREYILSYLVEPKKFYIEDMGSIFGTYIKVRNENSLIKG